MSTGRAALIATALTLPLLVLFVLLFANLTAREKKHSPSATPSVLPAITVDAPPLATAHAAACTSVLQKLPVRLAGLAPRVVHPHPDSPYVAAWGDPAVVWRCGVPRPAALTPGSSAQAIAVDGVWFLPVKGSGATAWTSVDRSVYIEISVPSSYTQPPLAPLAEAAKTLPQVCVIDPNAPPARNCTRRP